MPKGADAQIRRRERRAHRASAAGSSRAPSPAAAAVALTAGATTFRDFPLYDRDYAFDAGGALERWQAECGVGTDTADYARYLTGFLFAGDNGGTAIFQFVDVIDGKTYAVWRAVTACAAAMASVDPVVEPGPHKDGMVAHLGRYYDKARSVYDDPSITVPWESDAIHDVVFALARAETRRIDGYEVLHERLSFWASYFGHQVVIEAGEEGEPDVLKVVELEPEQKALEAARAAFAEAEETEAVENDMPCADCEHMAEDHAGGDNMGACSIEGCDCQGMQVPDGDMTIVAAFEPLHLLAVERAIAETVEDEALAKTLYDRVTFHLEKFELVTDGEAAVPQIELGEDQVQWVATIIPEGSLTDDGRAFAPGSVTWRDLPLTLGAMLDTPHADVVTDSKACGSITRVWREGVLVRAAGMFDTGEFGQEIARMVGEGTLRGISVDVAVHASEVRPVTDFFDENGDWRDEPLESDMDMMDVLFGESDVRPIFVVTEGVIGSVTICPFAAFADARIGIAESLVAAAQSPNVWTVTSQHGMVMTTPRKSLAAGANLLTPDTPVPAWLSPGDIVLNRTQQQLLASAAVRPEAEMFANPELTELTPLTVDDNGRIFGHAAGWGICHIAIPDVCTTAPHSVTDYDCFLLKEVVCADGTRVACGTITLDTGHAERGLGQVAATAHYDDTGTAVADVVTGEDEFGIWVAGALRPDVDETTVRKLRGAVLSGDWRYVELEGGGGNLELVALLAVNVPGFPIPRTRANIIASADGMEVVALVAAGAILPSQLSEEQQLAKISALADVAKISALAARAKAA